MSFKRFNLVLNLLMTLFIIAMIGYLSSRYYYHFHYSYSVDKQSIMAINTNLDNVINNTSYKNEKKAANIFVNSKCNNYKSIEENVKATDLHYKDYLIYRQKLLKTLENIDDICTIYKKETSDLKGLSEINYMNISKNFRINIEDQEETISSLVQRPISGRDNFIYYLMKVFEVFLTCMVITPKNNNT